VGVEGGVSAEQLREREREGGWSKYVETARVLAAKPGQGRFKTGNMKNVRKNIFLSNFGETLKVGH
jgi:hypothetical protein